MDAYIYRGALYCADCAAAIKAAKGWRPFYAADSETWPMGPYPNGGGEADSPQHCDACNVFLENPLTSDGFEYVRNALAEGNVASVNLDKAGRVGQREIQERILSVHRQWREFYSL